MKEVFALFLLLGLVVYSFSSALYDCYDVLDFRALPTYMNILEDVNNNQFIVSLATEYRGELINVTDAIIFVEKLNRSGDLQSVCYIITDESGKAVLSYEKNFTYMFHFCYYNLTEKKFCAFKNCLSDLNLNNYNDLLSIKKCELKPPIRRNLRQHIEFDIEQKPLKYYNGLAAKIKINNKYRSYPLGPSGDSRLTYDLGEININEDQKALCFPFIISFAILIASILMTGNNPFIWFNFDMLKNKGGYLSPKQTINNIEGSLNVGNVHSRAAIMTRRALTSKQLQGLVLRELDKSEIKKKISKETNGNKANNNKANDKKGMTFKKGINKVLNWAGKVYTTPLTVSSKVSKWAVKGGFSRKLAIGFGDVLLKAALGHGTGKNIMRGTLSDIVNEMEENYKGKLKKYYRSSPLEIANNIINNIIRSSLDLGLVAKFLEGVKNVKDLKTKLENLNKDYKKAQNEYKSIENFKKKAFSDEETGQFLGKVLSNDTLLKQVCGDGCDKKKLESIQKKISNNNNLNDEEKASVWNILDRIYEIKFGKGGAQIVVKEDIGKNLESLDRESLETYGNHLNEKFNESFGSGSSKVLNDLKNDLKSLKSEEKGLKSKDERPTFSLNDLDKLEAQDFNKFNEVATIFHVFNFDNNINQKVIENFEKGEAGEPDWEKAVKGSNKSFVTKTGESIHLEYKGGKIEYNSNVNEGEKEGKPPEITLSKGFSKYLKNRLINNLIHLKELDSDLISKEIEKELKKRGISQESIEKFKELYKEGYTNFYNELVKFTGDIVNSDNSNMLDSIKNFGVLSQKFGGVIKIKEQNKGNREASTSNTSTGKNKKSKY